MNNKQSRLPVSPQSGNIQLQALLAQQEFFSGPLPPPEALKAYGEINSEYPEPVAKPGWFCNRLLQFFALRAAKLHFLSVAVAKLKFCNSLS